MEETYTYNQRTNFLLSFSHMFIDLYPKLVSSRQFHQIFFRLCLVFLLLCYSFGFFYVLVYIQELKIYLRTRHNEQYLTKFMLKVLRCLAVWVYSSVSVWVCVCLGECVSVCLWVCQLLNNSLAVLYDVLSGTALTFRIYSNCGCIHN